MLESFMLRSNYAELAKQLNSIGAAVTTSFLFTRLWARTTRYKGLWWDDYFLIATWLLQLIGNGLSAAAPQRGFNIHNGAEHGWTFIFASLSFFYVSMACSKTAFAATLLRLSGGGGTRVLLWLAVAVAWAFGSALAVVSWLDICEQRVDVSIGASVACVPLKTLLWIHIGNNLATIFVDVVLACVPWRVVSKIYIPRREKFAVAASMSLTGCAAVVVIVRAVVTVYGQKLERQGLDWTYGSFVVFGLHQFEITIYVVAQTVPLLRVLYLGGEGKIKAGRKIRIAGPVVESSPGGPLTKRKATETMEAVQDIELVQLATGKIVARDSKGGKAIEGSQREASKSAGAAVVQVVAEGVLMPDVPDAPEVTEDGADTAVVDDEAHKLWADMGLSRRVWSQSPSPPQAVARHRRVVSSNLDITAPA